MTGPAIALFPITNMQMNMFFVCLHKRQHVKFLGMFAKLRKATVSSVMSVCPSIRMEELSSHRTDFHEIWHFIYIFFCRSVEKVQVSLNVIGITGT